MKKSTVLDGFTEAQLKYILIISALQASSATLSAVAENMGVKKPSACRMIYQLKDMGVLKMDESVRSKRVFLTNLGDSIAAVLEHQQYMIYRLLTQTLGASTEVAQRQTEKLIGKLEPEVVSLMEIKFNGFHEESSFREEDSDGQWCETSEPGSYYIPFKIVKADSDMISMGNKGFEHPCILVFSNEKQEIVLKAKDIFYKSILGKCLYGKLSSMKYKNRETGMFQVAECTNSVYRLPLSEMKCKYDSQGRIVTGMIRIKAQATVGIFHMAEAEADLVLDLTSVEISIR
jgi:Mn-dependent DtxR family transcriptional regulator